MFASFKRILTIAAITSLISGVLLTFLQQTQVIPLILEAERYEARQALPAGEDHAGQEHHAAGAQEQAGQEGWQPTEGLERNLYTALANMVVALGFALLLGAIAFLREAKLDWRSGLLWGLVGYAVFFVAPALGMAPELPGSHSGALEQRQLWWLLTVLSTGAGFAFIFFNDQIIVKVLGAVLLAVPHVIGAPYVPPHDSAVPPELIQSFVVATVITNAAFWLSLGGFYGFLDKKLST